MLFEKVTLPFWIEFPKNKIKKKKNTKKTNSVKEEWKALTNANKFMKSYNFWLVFSFIFLILVAFF